MSGRATLAGGRRDEVEPVRGQLRTGHGRREDEEPPPPRHGRELAHELLVGQRLQPDRVVDLARGLPVRGQAHEVGDEVAEGDRLAARSHPARRDHDRQVVDEVADHLERSRAGPDDDAGAQLGHGHRGRRAAARRSSRPRAQVRGRLALRLQPAEVDDAPHARALGSLAERRRGAAVELREASPRRHRVDEVVRDLDAVERDVERGGGRARRRRRSLRPPTHAPQGCRDTARRPTHGGPRSANSGDEVRPDVPARADDQDVGHG